MKTSQSTQVDRDAKKLVILVTMVIIGTCFWFAANYVRIHGIFWY